MENAILSQESDVPNRIAQQTLAKRGAGYASEVRRLLDAALEVMRQNGTTSKARVADIVAAAGLSNDAFYRHFKSKDALVAALLEDGAERLARYVKHQMDKETEPAGKVRRWVEGILAQTQPEIAETTLAVLWNGGGVGENPVHSRHSATVLLGALLHEPFQALGSTSPALHAELAAHATLGKMAGYLWARATPTSAEIDQITGFCLKAVTKLRATRAPPSTARAAAACTASPPASAAAGR
jgi:AcrR family transcriptional regulator